MYAIEISNTETGERQVIHGVYRTVPVAKEVLNTLMAAQRVMRADSAFNFKVVSV